MRIRGPVTYMGVFTPSSQQSCQVGLLIPVPPFHRRGKGGDGVSCWCVCPGGLRFGPQNSRKAKLLQKSAQRLNSGFLLGSCLRWGLEGEGPFARVRRASLLCAVAAAVFRPPVCRVVLGGARPLTGSVTPPAGVLSLVSHLRVLPRLLWTVCSPCRARPCA